MGIMCLACTCGFSDKLLRGKLEEKGYRDFLTVPIHKGKDKSKSALNTIPQTDGVQMVRNHLDGCSKYAIVVGYDNEHCRWVDMANGKAFQNSVDLEFILRDFT